MQGFRLCKRHTIWSDARLLLSRYKHPPPIPLARPPSFISHLLCPSLFLSSSLYRSSLISPWSPSIPLSSSFAPSLFPSSSLNPLCPSSSLWSPLSPSFSPSCPFLSYILKEWLRPYRVLSINLCNLMKANLHLKFYLALVVCDPLPIKNSLIGEQCIIPRHFRCEPKDFRIFRVHVSINGKVPLLFYLLMNLASEALLWTQICVGHLCCELPPHIQYSWLCFRSVILYLCQPIIASAFLSTIWTTFRAWCISHESWYGIKGGTPKKHSSLHIISDIVNWGPPVLYWNFNKEGKLGHYKQVICNKNGKAVHVCISAADSHS